MNCSKCGTELIANTKYCYKCGKKIATIDRSKRKKIIVGSVLVVILLAIFVIYNKSMMTDSIKKQTQTNTTYEVDGKVFNTPEEVNNYLGINALPTNSNNTQAKTETSITSSAELVEPDVYMNGPVFIHTESGTYSIEFKEAKILPEHLDYDGSMNRPKVYQIVYEVSNIDFQNEYSKGVNLAPWSLVVSDSNGYILETMNTGQSGDWMNYNEIILPKKKCVIKYTYIIQSDDANYLDICIPERNVTCRCMICE